MIYWRVATPQAYERVVSELRDEERARLRLEARTLDRVVPGEQQSEVDHGVRTDGSTTGVTHGRPFRDATGRSSTRISKRRPRSLARYVTSSCSGPLDVPRLRS